MKIIQALLKFISIGKSVPEEMAILEFKKTYSKKHNSSMCQAISKHDYIVTICHGCSKPQRRTWWKVSLQHSCVEELKLDEARKLIKIPIWM
ncbi:MAG: hypothetical protein COA78_07545 [Blastopirellula sp.]|nr:MAG: hypothetical protein COA78_07545 [Blastopirellula sp.]